MHTPNQDSRLAVEWVDVSKVFESPSNPRRNDVAVPHVAASLRRFGFQQPVVCRRSGEVVAGNTRLKAALQLGMTTVPVVWFEGSDLDATAYSIADNRTHEFATWDEPALSRILEQLRKEDSLEAVGYTVEDIDALIHKLTTGAPMGAAAAAPGATPGKFAPSVDDHGPETPPVQPVSRSGDMWILGEHRLLCGDSTKAADIERVLAGETAILLSTDPPYCVDYTGMDRPIHDGKPSGKDWSHVYREVDIADLGEFLDAVLKACLPRLTPEAPIYCWHAHVQQPVIARVFEQHDILLHQVLVWVKPVATFGHSFYRWKHEPCAFGWRRGHRPMHGLGQMESVWMVDWEGKARVVGNEHPTQKPLRLFEIPMEVHTAEGAIVLEPFSGSGSQLLAAEKLKRRCRAVEISPHFVDAAIRRFRKAGGAGARLEATGQGYAEVAEERGVMIEPNGDRATEAGAA